MKVALVHDWLTGMRGCERVLLSLARLFPEAPIFTLLHLSGSVAPELEVRTRSPLAAGCSRRAFGLLSNGAWTTPPAQIRRQELCG